MSAFARELREAERRAQRPFRMRGPSGGGMFGGGASGLPSYLGSVATRGSVNDNTFANTGPFTSRTFHIMRETTAPRPIWAASALVNPSGEGGTGTLTVGAAAIEFPAGTFIPVTWGGGGSVVATAGNLTATPDVPPIVLPAGTGFWVDAELTGSVNVYFADGTQKSGALGDKLQTGGTDIHNIVDNNAGIIFPSIIVGATTKRTLLGIGDSRIAGLNVAADANGNSGDFQVAFSPTYGGTRYGCTGITAATFAGNHALALKLAAFHSDVWLQPGINDVIANVSAPSMTATRQANIAAFTAIAKRVWLSTMQPANASNNQWINFAGQTPGVHDATRVTLNTDTRSGLVYTTAAGFFEFANLVEHLLNDGDWLFDGTPFKYTGDGAHLTAFSVALAAGLFTI